MNLFKLWKWTILFWGLGLPAVAQITITQVEAPEGLVACGQPGWFRLHLADEQHETFSGEALAVQLPAGMNYVEGSIEGAGETAGGQPSLLEFTLQPVAGRPFLEVSFQVAIDCSFSNVNPIRYIVSANGQVFTAQAPSLANYFFPEIVAVSSQNQSIYLSAGQAGQRSFSVIQATPGARLDSLFLVYRYDPGLQSSFFNVGATPPGDTLAITGAALPGGDGYFDFGDTLFLQETIRLLGCAESTSEMELFWRCDGRLCQAFYTDGLAALASGAPNLVITNQNGFASQNQANDAAQVGGGFCQTLSLQYRIENAGAETAYGAGAAYGLAVAFGLNSNLYSSPLPADISRFPNWSFSAQAGSAPLPVSAYQFPDPDPLLGFNIRFDSLASDPDGAGGLEDLDGDGFFDDLPVGASTLLTILVEYDPAATADCTLLSGFPNTGGAQTSFRIGYRHLDQCGSPFSYWYGVTDPGINIIELFVHRQGGLIFQLEPENLQAGASSYLSLAPTGDWSSPCAPTDSFVLQLVLPRGLQLGPEATRGPGSHYGLVEVSGDTARIAGSERGGIDDPWEIPLVPDCSSPVFDSLLEVSFLYYCSPDCPIPKAIDCQEIELDYLPQCTSCEEGVITRSFEMRRRTLGWQDVFQTRKVNPAQNPGINLKAALNYDSVEMRLTGVYKGDGPFDSLYARVYYNPIDLIYIQPQQPHFTPLSLSMAYFSQSDGLLACPVDTWVTRYDAADGKHYIEAGLEGLFGPGGRLEGVVRQDGDSLVLSIMALVTGNTPIKALPVPELRGGFYTVAEGRDSFCNQFLEHFVLENAVPRAHVSYGVQLHFGCEEIFFTGNFINNFGHLLDGDQFPDEIRPLADVSEVRILLEGHWGFIPGSTTLLANGSLNGANAPSLLAPGITASLPDPAITFDGTFTVLTYANPGTWPAGDLAINGNEAQHNLRFRAKPGCTVPRGDPFRIRMETEFTRFTHAPPEWQVETTEASITTAKSYEAQRARLSLASPQVATPVNDTVNWAFQLDNMTNYAGADKVIYNNWIAIEADTALSILELRDVSDPAAPVSYLPAAYGSGKAWFQVGALGAFASRRFQLAGLFGECRLAQLTLYHGFSCLGYPDPTPDEGYPFPGPSAYFCPADSLRLMARPGNIALAVEVSPVAQPVQLCQTLGLWLDIRNLQLPYAYELAASLALPEGVRLLPGSSVLEYPPGSGNLIPLNDPVQAPDGQWDWHLADALPFLRSVAQSPANQCRLHFSLETDCDFLSGRRILLEAGARSSCGQESRRRAYSLPIRIEGIPPIINDYAPEVAWPGGGVHSCSPSRLHYKLTNLGPFPTSAIEFGAFALPYTLDYIEGSLAGVRNAPGGIAENSINGNRRLLAFALPPGVPPGDSIVFSIEVQNQLLEELPCDSLGLEAFSLLRANVACANAGGGSCDIFAISANRLYTVPVQGSRLKITPGAWASSPAGAAGEWVAGQALIENITGAPIVNDSIRLSVYYDENGNGMPDGPPEELLARRHIPLPYLEAGGILLDSIQFFAPTARACRLLLALDDPWHTCSCDTLYALVPPPAVFNAGPDLRACHRDTVTLGTDRRQDGLSFEWLGLGSAPIDALSHPDSGITQAYFFNAADTTVVYRYVLTTTRAGQCVTTDTVSITVLPEIQAAVTVASDYHGQDISCFGFSDGALEVTVTAGTPPFIFEWSGFAQSSPVFGGLGAGAYTFGIEDADGCTQAVTGTLTEPPPLELSLEADSVTCPGGADGRAAALASGGSPPYDYNWGGPVADGLSAGLYHLTLTDANGCLLADSIEVGAPAPLQAVVIPEPASCADRADGRAAVQEMSGGTAPYTASWDDGRQGFSNVWLSPGLHQVTLTDARGCTLALNVDIEAPPHLILESYSISHLRCYGSGDGAIQLAINGGTPPYGYLWNDGSVGPSQSALGAGAYQATITDAQGCRLASPPFLVSQPPPLALSVISAEAVSCFGDEDGSASVKASGGTAPYAYSWDQGGTDSLAAGLAPAVYGVSVTDANGCRDSALAIVNEPPSLVLEYHAIPPNCTGRLGMVSLQAPGSSGTPPFLYSIDGGTTFTNDSTFHGLAAGAYPLAIQDAHGCTVGETIQISDPSPLAIYLPELLTVNYGEPAGLSVEIGQAYGLIQASWWPADAYISCHDCLDPVFTPVHSTTYHLSVVDENGCRADTTIQVIVNRLRRVFIPNAFSPNHDGSNDAFLAYGGPEAVRVEKMIVAGRWGNIVFRGEGGALNDPRSGWDGRFNGQRMPAGVYAYQIDVLFSDGIVITYKGDVLLLD